MQTRKNRKNDEFAYEKMVKLRRDLMKAITLLEMVKRREKLKREYINLTVEIVEKRYQLRDWKGEILNEVVKSKRSKAEGRGIRTKNSGMVTSKSGQRVMSDVTSRKRSKPEPDDVLALAGENVPPVHIIRPRTPVLGSVVSSPAPPKKRLECVFEFRARPGCKYSFKRSPSPDSTRASAVDPLLDNAKGDERYQFHLASLRFPVDRSLGFTRRRIGRGGRYVRAINKSMNRFLLPDFRESGAWN
jgi:enhancer of polycomb-like protein